MTIRKADDPRLGATLVCLVLADGISTGPSPEGLARELTDLAGRRAGEDFPPVAVKESVRAMLRAGGFKPAGRQKPASEYLAQAAREGRFPLISAPVDCNNLLSLETGLPISLLDSEAVGPEALVRICGTGESYVFNASGQEMDLEGLVCVCGALAESAAGVPLGNPVKDSMRGKIKEGTRDVAGFIFAPAANWTPTMLAAVGERFAGLLSAYCGAGSALVAGVV